MSMGFSRQEWGTHVNPWLIHVNVWQKPWDSPGKIGEHMLIRVNIWQNPLQYCKVISLQLIKINEKKKKKEYWSGLLYPLPEDLPDPGIKVASQIMSQISPLPSSRVIVCIFFPE